MGPREEDNSLLLLGAVSLICGLIAFAPSLLEPTLAMADGQSGHGSPQAISASTQLAPVRVIVPFTPNTSPGER